MFNQPCKIPKVSLLNSLDGLLLIENTQLFIIGEFHESSRLLIYLCNWALVFFHGLTHLAWELKLKLCFHSGVVPEIVCALLNYSWSIVVRKWFYTGKVNASPQIFFTGTSLPSPLPLGKQIEKNQGDKSLSFF